MRHQLPQESLVIGPYYDSYFTAGELRLKDNAMSKITS